MRISCILIISIIATGCGFPSHHHDPPEVLAERTNSTDVVEQIIERRNYTSQENWFTPEGSHKVITYDFHFYLQEKGKPNRNLPLPVEEARRCDKFAAVEGTPLWVGVGAVYSANTKHPVGHPLMDRGKLIKSYGENDFYIFVFDDQQVLMRHQFLVISRLETPSARFRFEDGNHSIIFLSPTGPQRYDVLKDSVTAAGPATWNPPHL
jgi:hypothetical protein